MGPSTLRGPRRLAAVGVVAVLCLATIGCGDDGDTASSAPTGATRPTVAVALTDTSLSIPTTIPGGLVDVHLTAATGQQPHHVAFLRLAAGVTFERYEAAGGDDDSLFTFAGGNGLLAPGQDLTLTLDLRPGRYEVLDLPFGEPLATARTTVRPAAAGAAAPTPAATETVGLGPDLAYSVPDGFGTAGGTWRFANDSQAHEGHEAVLLALPAGTTTADVVRWAEDPGGPPPADLVGGFGPLAPGAQGWIDHAGPLAPGSYAFACFLPGAGGRLHVADGMIAGFTVPGPAGG